MCHPRELTGGHSADRRSLIFYALRGVVEQCRGFGDMLVVDLHKGGSASSKVDLASVDHIMKQGMSKNFLTRSLNGRFWVYWRNLV